MAGLEAKSSGGFQGERELPKGAHLFEQTVFQEAVAKIVPPDFWTDERGWIPFVNRVVLHLEEKLPFSKYRTGDLLISYLKQTYNLERYSLEEVFAVATKLREELSQFSYLQSYVAQYRFSEFSMGLKPLVPNPKRKIPVLTYEAYAWEKERESEQRGHVTDEAPPYATNKSNAAAKAGSRAASRRRINSYWRERRDFKDDT